MIKLKFYYKMSSKQNNFDITENILSTALIIAFVIMMSIILGIIVQRKYGNTSNGDTSNGNDSDDTSNNTSYKLSANDIELSLLQGSNSTFTMDMDQKIISVTKIDNTVFFTIYFDGIFGFAPTEMDNDHNTIIFTLNIQKMFPDFYQKITSLKAFPGIFIASIPGQDIITDSYSAFATDGTNSDFLIAIKLNQTPTSITQTSTSSISISNMILLD